MDFFSVQIKVPAKALNLNEQALLVLRSHKHYEDEWEEKSGIVQFDYYSAEEDVFDSLADVLIENEIPFDMDYNAGNAGTLKTRFFRPATERQSVIDVTKEYTENTLAFIPTAELKPLLTLSGEEAKKGLEALLTKIDPEISDLELFAA